LERTRQRIQGVAIMGLALGIIFLASGLSRPTISSMRTIDLLHLLSTGMCLGAGLAGLIVNLASRREG
jgi:hypothetical protein